MTAPELTWQEAVIRRQLARVAAMSAHLGTVSSVVIDRATAQILASLDLERPIPADLLTRTEALLASRHRDELERELAAMHGRHLGRNYPKGDTPA